MNAFVKWWLEKRIVRAGEISFCAQAWNAAIDAALQALDDAGTVSVAHDKPGFPAFVRADIEALKSTEKEK
jgi:hypothetical protein